MLVTRMLSVIYTFIPVRFSLDTEPKLTVSAPPSYSRARRKQDNIKDHKLKPHTYVQGKRNPLQDLLLVRGKTILEKL